MRWCGASLWTARALLREGACPGQPEGPLEVSARAVQLQVGEG